MFEPTRLHECPALLAFERLMNERRGKPNEAWTDDGLIAHPEGAVVFHEPSGLWHLANGEYAGPIFYCPWCGLSLISHAAFETPNG